jgi:predicted O-linked N-acetylglucosamine transferase (SPINDLY family)
MQVEGGAMADAADTLYRNALAACEQGRVDEGIGLLRQALADAPDDARIHRLLGMALTRVGRHQEALASLERAIALGRATADLHGLQADVLVALGRLDEAVASYDRALALAPGSVDDWCNRGAVLHDLKRHDAAVASFDRCIALAPDYAPAHYNRGNACAALARHDAAIASFDRVLALVGDHADAHNNRGQSLRALGQTEQALASFERALATAPDHLAALVNRAGVLGELRRQEEALLAADKVLAISPGVASAWQMRGHALMALKRLPDAIASYERAAQLGLSSATAMLGYCSLLACDWPRAERAAPALGALIEADHEAMSPFALLPFAFSPALQRKAVEIFVAQSLGDAALLPASPRPPRNGRIRLGYVSSDFGSHAVTTLIAGLLARHDRSRFDVVGFAVGSEPDDAMRRRIAAACTEFHELGRLTDADAAARILDFEIDIAVDLTGYTEGARPGILARRPAPVQVSYLGYLGTMGGSSIDYILADAIALPFDQQPHYAEKIVHLPDCFLPADDTLAMSRPASRAEAGLPDQAIVLCSFNNSYKFRSGVFDIWMRLLRDFDRCVLWLLASNEQCVANLRREAGNRGVDPERLIFASSIAFPDHLARQTLADLFLDTLPYNAGATAVAALWAGVPLLTAIGDTLVGRMASSMLHGVGLPELAAADLADYEAKARTLVGNPSKLADLRAKLARQRSTHALFDTDRSRRNLEAAYRTMWDIFSRGEPARGFAVTLPEA